MYTVIGAVALLFGIVALISPRMIESEAGQTLPVSHLVREQGAGGVFIGLMAIWCVFNYELRWSVHYFLTIFAFLIATVHWFDYSKERLSWMSPVFNSVPFVALLMMAVLST